MRLEYKLLISLSILVVAFYGLMGYRFQPQKTASIGSMSDGSTACDGSTDPTADLTCVNTGTLTVGGFAQMSVSWTYDRGAGAAGTAVHVQCDTKDTAYDQWYMTSFCTGNTCVLSDWTWTVSASTAYRLNFGVNAEEFRCRGWITNGNSNDQLKLNVRIASTVKGP